MKLGQTQEEAAAALAAEVKRLDREAETTAAVMEKSGKQQLEKLAEARTAAEAARATADRLKVQHAQLFAEAEREEKARLDSANPSDEDLKAAKISAAQFIATHLDPAEIDRRAKAFAAEKVAAILPAARFAVLDAMKADAAVAEIEVEVAFCKSAPLTARLEAERTRLKATDAAASIGLGALAVAMSKRDDLRHRLELAAGYSHRGGRQLYDLDVAAIERLKFDPIIRDAALPQLEELIEAVRAVGPGGKVTTLTIAGDGALRWRL